MAPTMMKVTCKCGREKRYIQVQEKKKEVETLLTKSCKTCERKSKHGHNIRA